MNLPGLLIVGAGNVGLGLAEAARGRFEVTLADPHWTEERRQAATALGARIETVDALDEPAFTACLERLRPQSLALAAGQRDGKTWIEDPAGFRRSVNANYDLILLPLRAALTLQKKGGLRLRSIAIVTSTSAHHASLEASAYCPAKWACSSLARSAAGEFEALGVRLFEIAPATLKNRYSSQFLTDRGHDPLALGQRIVRLLEREAVGTFFFPRRMRLLRILERLIPSVLDRIQRAPRHPTGPLTAPRVVWITGATSGLGEALAHQHDQDGRELVLFGRDTAKLQKTCSEIHRAKTRAVLLDLGDEAAVARWSTMESQALPAPDRVYLNAGATAPGSIAEVSLPTHLRQRELLLHSPLAIAAAAIRLCSSGNRPALIFILSTTAILGRRGLAAYGSYKAALWGAVRTAQRGLGDRARFFEILPATFESGLQSSSKSSNQAMNARLLTSAAVANQVERSLDHAKRTTWIPLEARALHWMEACLPSLARRLFP